MKKISYERRAYDSVDEKSLSLVMSRKKNLAHIRLKLPTENMSRVSNNLTY